MEDETNKFINDLGTLLDNLRINRIQFLAGKIDEKQKSQLESNIGNVYFDYCHYFSDNFVMSIIKFEKLDKYVCAYMYVNYGRGVPETIPIFREIASKDN